LSFKEGDKITEIDKVDENWWQGTANGASGLFPGKSGPESDVGYWMMS